MKNIKLILEINVGNFPEDCCNKDIDFWEEYFFQSDFLLTDLDIVDVKEIPI